MGGEGGDDVLSAAATAMDERPSESRERETRRRNAPAALRTTTQSPAAASGAGEASTSGSKGSSTNASRTRFRFSEKQLKIMKKVFHDDNNRRPTSEEMQEIADKTEVDVKRIQNWFKRMRFEHKDDEPVKKRKGAVAAKGKKAEKSAGASTFPSAAERPLEAIRRLAATAADWVHNSTENLAPIKDSLEWQLYASNRENKFEFTVNDRSALNQVRELTRDQMEAKQTKRRLALTKQLGKVGEKSLSRKRKAPAPATFGEDLSPEGEERGAKVAKRASRLPPTTALHQNGGEEDDARAPMDVSDDDVVEVVDLDCEPEPELPVQGTGAAAQKKKKVKTPPKTKQAEREAAEMAEAPPPAKENKRVPLALRMMQFGVSRMREEASPSPGESPAAAKDRNGDGNGDGKPKAGSSKPGAAAANGEAKASSSKPAAAARMFPETPPNHNTVTLVLQPDYDVPNELRVRTFGSLFGEHGKLKHITRLAQARQVIIVFENSAACAACARSVRAHGCFGLRYGKDVEMSTSATRVAPEPQRQQNANPPRPAPVINSRLGQRGGPLNVLSNASYRRRDRLESSRPERQSLAPAASQPPLPPRGGPARVYGQETTCEKIASILDTYRTKEGHPQFSHQKLQALAGLTEMTPVASKLAQLLLHYVSEEKRTQLSQARQNRPH